ncbi:MAG: sn-glycerol-3-phosphate ABC transporter ATP-binding protein UgpC [Oscillospiraceae bacterium]|nr:sn-glycerol-3-phosphate ABC transporter ATP-binding protein UgpC [Oscillospiraceae bacterium]
MAAISLQHITKVYDKGVTAVQDFCLDIADGEFIVLVGPSGCGKSTTLRMIAGLEDITSGQLLIDGAAMNDVPPKEWDIAMVFQSYALYPHMTVYDNMAFALKMRKTPKEEIDRRVRAAAETLNITDILTRKPKALSGGQQQRAAIGRAIVREPKVFLMDEPLSNLDAKLRSQTRTELMRLRHRIDATFIYVTHDQTEAMTLGDRIVVMKDGYIQQIGTPQEVFRQPKNMFVAGFIGSPQMNFLPASLAGSSLTISHETGQAHIGLPNLVTDADAARPVVAGIRPEHITLAPAPTPDALTAHLEAAETTGSETWLHLTIAESPVVVRIPADSYSPEMDKAPIYIKPQHERIHLFDPDTERRLDGK